MECMWVCMYLLYFVNDHLMLLLLQYDTVLFQTVYGTVAVTCICVSIWHMDHDLRDFLVNDKHAPQ